MGSSKETGPIRKELTQDDFIGTSMSGLPEDVIAILCSDIHLCHKSPVARSSEPDWYIAMGRQLTQLGDLQRIVKAPVICAGDIFDRWNSPPELINFAMKYMPNEMYAIPGQHDLPNHNYDDIQKSAYWTLVESGKINHLYPGEAIELADELFVYAFPWGYPVESLGNEKEGIHLAVIHSYIWAKNKGYPGAPDEMRVSKWIPKLQGYDSAVFGDNHKGFMSGQIMNCGTFMRRKMDEYNYHPMVGLLRADGAIQRFYLDCSEDVFIDVDKTLAVLDKIMEAEGFVDELEKLGTYFVDFRQVLKDYCLTNSTPKRIRAILEAVLEIGEK